MKKKTKASKTTRSPAEAAAGVATVVLRRAQAARKRKRKRWRRRRRTERQPTAVGCSPRTTRGGDDQGGAIELCRRGKTLESFSKPRIPLDKIVFRAQGGPKNENIKFKGLRPPAAGPQKNEGMRLRGYEATRLSLW